MRTASPAPPTARHTPDFHETPAGVGGALVYAVGDIHGRYDLFTVMLARIVADAGARANGRRPILVTLGDYVDRGPDSARMITALDWLRRDGRMDLRALKGNHEEALLDFIATPAEGAGWLGFGGDATLRAYGVVPPEDFADAAACVRARDDLMEVMPASHPSLLRDLETMVVIGDYAFVHAGVRPRVPLARQQPRDLLWIRENFLAHTEKFEKRIVHGHSWNDAEPEIYDNRIGLDTGAYQTGVLTAVRIEDGAVQVLRAIRDGDRRWPIA